MKGRIKQGRVDLCSLLFSVA